MLKIRKTPQGQPPENETLIRNLRVNLAYHRKRLGLSQTTLADQAGVSPAVISRLETGKYPIKQRAPLGTVRSLARVMSVTIAELIGPPFETELQRLTEVIPDSIAKSGLANANDQRRQRN